jgi:hypothetical protein
VYTIESGIIYDERQQPFCQCSANEDALQFLRDVLPDYSVVVVDAGSELMVSAVPV